MNALININEQPVYQDEEKEESNKVTFGDIFAVSTLGFYTLFILVISSWSVGILLTENSSSMGPIGFLVDLIKISGLV